MSIYVVSTAIVTYIFIGGYECPEVGVDPDGGWEPDEAEQVDHAGAEEGQRPAAHTRVAQPGKGGIEQAPTAYSAKVQITLPFELKYSKLLGQLLNG